MSLKHLSRWLPPLLGIILLGSSIWAISRELQHYHPTEILRSLTAIPKFKLLTAIALTLLNCLIFTGYDTLALRYIRHPLSYYNTALAAITSIPIANSVGFALLSGSAIRYRFYAPLGLTPTHIAQVIFFCNLSFWLGLFAVGGVVFLFVPVDVPTLLHLPFKSAHSIGIIFLSFISAYLFWNLSDRQPLQLKHWVIPHVSIQICLTQIVISSLDWALAAAVLYVLLPSSALSYSDFLSVYLLGQLAGLISNVPGGLGVFETVILLLLSSSISSVALFGSLLTYRAIYYLLPLSIAVVMLGRYELQQRWNKHDPP
jgi:uncharacterized membrane protein YbhN (UPF0104 family)